MGRKAGLFGFWLVGYVLGMFAWLVRVPVLQFIESIGLSANTAEALIAGLFGSGVMLVAVLLWSFLSSS
jgi:uncharacterized membrane protein YuzA (DUF378 family)